MNETRGSKALRGGPVEGALGALHESEAVGGFRPLTKLKAAVDATFGPDALQGADGMSKTSRPQR